LFFVCFGDGSIFFTERKEYATQTREMSSSLFRRLFRRRRSRGLCKSRVE